MGRTLSRWRTEIANWHVARVTNAATEAAIICSASEGVVDVADTRITACRGRVIYSGVVSATAEADGRFRLAGKPNGALLETLTPTQNAKRQISEIPTMVRSPRNPAKA
ncbi:MAG: transposase [Acidimicrobiia bacterium]|nr:transposase [Acidimicrobiia bacterium]MCY4456779.1 hypothetical protein [Acidimicrobiaceae bacterium]